MKKFSISCDFNGQMAPFTIYVGDPKAGHHPVSFQSNWLSKERGGTIPQEVMDSLTKLKDLADKNGVSFEELCVYALGSAQEEAEEDTELPTELTAEDETLPAAEETTMEETEATSAINEETKLETKELEEPDEKEEEDKENDPDTKEGA